MVHLTNVAIQKQHESYSSDTGCKLSLDNLRTYLVSCHGVDAVTNLFEEMQMIITRSLFAVTKPMIHDKHCFELFGYDLLIDTNLKPWLIEVNSSPSLTADTESDYRLKFSMLDDVLAILDMERR